MEKTKNRKLKNSKTGVNESCSKYSKNSLAEIPAYQKKL